MSASDIQKNRDELDMRIDIELEAIRRELGTHSSQAHLRDIESRLDAFLTLESTRVVELRKIRLEISRRLDENYLEELNALAARAASGDNSARAIFNARRDEYLPFLSDSSRAAVEELAARIHGSDSRRFREGINAMRLSSDGNMAEKARLMERYVHSPFAAISPAERQEILRAVGTARRLIEEPLFRVSLHWAGTFVGRERFRVIVEIGGQPISFEWCERTRMATWDSTEAVRWAIGQPVSVKVERKGFWGDRIIREIRDESPLSIRLLGGIISRWENFAEHAQYDELIEDPASFRVALSVDGFEQEDWNLLHKYFHPGEFWQ